MIRHIPIKLLLIFSFLLSGLILTLLISFVSFNVAKTELKAQAFRQLESVRNLKKDQILQYFSERTADISVLVENPFVIQACKDLDSAFRSAGGSRSGKFKAYSEEKFDSPPEYRTVHDRYFPFFRKVISNYGYYDFFFMDPLYGETIFTIRKESDFGIRASEMPSSLRDVWEAAAREGRVSLSDTRPYPPSNNVPAQFLAAPMRENGATIGVIALQISRASIDAIMQERSGMWKKGETYLVGQDKKMRSDSYLDPQNHTVDASFLGTVEKNGVDTAASRQALGGIAGLQIIENYSGNRVLSAYTPIEIQGVKWALIAEIDEKEIDTLIGKALNTKIITLLILSAAIVLLLALTISIFISRSIRNVILQLEKMMDDVLKGKLQPRADAGSVGVDFQGVVTQTNDLIRAFTRQMEEKRKLEEHVQYAQRLDAIGTLAGGIAHDFNNILTSMFAYAHIIRSRVPKNSAAEEDLNLLVSSIERARGLVRQILTFCRQVKTEKEPVEVTSVVLDTAKLLKATLPKNIQIGTLVDPEEIWIEANPSQVHQILMNLCTNSYHALQPKGGFLQISTGIVVLGEREFPDLEAGSYCRLTVIDNGHGMDPETQKHIFEPFYTTKPPGQGTGMGLAVVHGIILGHGGAIRVESEIGEGARFDIYLPLLCEEIREKMECVPEEMVQGQGHILFVDDDEPICDSGKKALESFGYTVTATLNSIEAVELFQESAAAFDVVITDLNMPYLSGLELAERIRAIRPDIPILVTTGYNELLNSGKTKEIGIQEIIMKPYTGSELSRLVADILLRSARKR